MDGTAGQSPVPFVTEEGPTCSSCKEPIPPDARVCLKCNNYQDWRRWISMGQVTLTLIVALVSVIATGGPVLLALWRGERSDVRVASLGCTAKEFQVILTNAGTRAATLRGATARHGSETAALQVPDGQHVIEEGKTRVVTLQSSGKDAFFGATGPTCGYTVELDLLRFDHTAAPQPLPCSCPRPEAK